MIENMRAFAFAAAFFACAAPGAVALEPRAEQDEHLKPTGKGRGEKDPTEIGRAHV